ncbi:MAG: hypothetical protein V1492_04995 [Candidatus Micrarchaeota archaeon]
MKNKKQLFEVCANCGQVGSDAAPDGKHFKCPKCGCEVSVVMSRELFAQLAKTFGRNE